MNRKYSNNTEVALKFLICCNCNQIVEVTWKKFHSMLPELIKRNETD